MLLDNLNIYAVWCRRLHHCPVSRPNLPSLSALEPLPPEQSPIMGASNGLLFASLSCLVTHVLAQCDPGDGLSQFGFLSVYENGTFKDVSEPPSVSKSEFLAVSVQEGDVGWSSLFTIEEIGNNWVLKVAHNIWIKAMFPGKANLRWLVWWECCFWWKAYLWKKSVSSHVYLSIGGKFYKRT